MSATSLLALVVRPAVVAVPALSINSSFVRIAVINSWPTVPTALSNNVK
jgi:hypothetical protein